MSDDNSASRVAYFLAGMGLGAVVALLFAPRSGKETREFISHKADEGRDYVTKKTEEGREFVTARSQKLRTQAEDAVEKAKDVVSKEKQQLSTALEAGKQAYQEEKTKKR